MRFFLLSLFVLTCAAQAKDCRDAGTGDSCQVKISDLHPTQFNVGFREIKKRAARFAKMDNKQLDQYLEANPAPVVLGPDHGVYIVDRHHMARALAEAGYDGITANVLGDLSSLAMEQFWAQMSASGWVLLEDRGVAGQSPEALPKRILDMTDDPYRSLAWSVSNKGGYQETGIPYADFHWADFFRTRIDMSGGHYRDAVKAALKLAHSPEARDLPGYTPDAATPPPARGFKDLFR